MARWFTSHYGHAQATRHLRPTVASAAYSKAQPFQSHRCHHHRMVNVCRKPDNTQGTLARRTIHSYQPPPAPMLASYNRVERTMPTSHVGSERLTALIWTSPEPLSLTDCSWQTSIRCLAA